MKSTTRRLLVIALAFSLSGCGTGSRRESADSLHSMTGQDLCYVYISGRGTGAYRQSVSEEIQRFGIDCRDHLPVIQARLIADGIRAEEQRARTQQLLELANRLNQPAAAVPARPIAIYRRGYISGLNRVCVYDRVGSEFVFTVGAAEICPPTAP